MKTKYVVGFAFNEPGNNVLLILKERPTWQKGKYNGIGGHVEEGENYNNAMVREFKEECGIETNESDWVYYMKLSGDDWEVVFFYTTLKNGDDPQSTTDETVSWVSVYNLKIGYCISNLHWLIPMALYHRKFPEEFKEG